jgi:hypothetical protein
MMGSFFSSESVDGGALHGGIIWTMLSLPPCDALSGVNGELRRDGRAFDDLKGDRFAAAAVGGLSTTLESALWRGWRAGFGVAEGIGAWLIIGVDWLKKSSSKMGNGSSAWGCESPDIGGQA